MSTIDIDNSRASFDVLLRHTLSKADNSTGVMVALFPAPDVAAALAQPGGEAAEDLHVTLAFLGDASALRQADADQLRQTVAEFAARTAPISGTVSGVGLFTAGPEPVTYASVDLPSLPPIRESLINCLTWEDFAPSQEHGFTPHITLAYAMSPVRVEPMPITFDTITLAIGGERIDFPLYGVRKADAAWDVPIWKAQDTPERIVYGVVLQPGVVDSQGDVVSAAEIEQAAHRFLVESRKHDVQHDEQHNPAVETVESYIAPADLEVAGRPVLKGSWVMATKVNDDIIWSAIEKKAITGYSMGGTGVRSES